MFETAIEIILKLNKGRLIGNILTINAYEKKNVGFLPKGKHKQIYKNIKTEILCKILEQSCENSLLVSVFLQHIVTLYESGL